MMKAMTALTNGRRNAALSKSPEDMESCVICGRVTDIPVCLPISKRKTYMPAAGHLCDVCCQKYCGVKDLRLLPWLWDEFFEESAT